MSVLPAGEVGRALAGRKVESLAMLLHGSELQLHLCGPGEKVRKIIALNDCNT